MFKGKSLACSLTCTFSALRSRDLQKCSPPSPAPQCQARSKDTSAERKVRRRRIIPRPSCNWATHPQPGKPREGSGSLERSLQTKVRNDAGKIRGQSSSGDGTTLGRGHWLFRPRKVSLSRCLTFLLKELLTSGQRREFWARGLSKDWG